MSKSCEHSNFVCKIYYSGLYAIFISKSHIMYATILRTAPLWEQIIFLYKKLIRYFHTKYMGRAVKIMTRFFIWKIESIFLLKKVSLFLHKNNKSIFCVKKTNWFFPIFLTIARMGRGPNTSSPEKPPFYA